MMIIQNKYEIGQSVYLKTDPDQLERIIVGISIRSYGLLYELANNEKWTWHHEIEISDTKNYTKT